MTDSKWDIYLIGEPQAGVNRASLVRNLSALFKKDVPVIEKMLRKPRSLIKTNLDLATAKKYQAVIHKAGGQSQLREHGAAPVVNEAPTSTVLPSTVPPSALSIEPIETPVASHEAESTYGSPYETPESNLEAPDRFCFKCGTPLRSGEVSCPSCFAMQPRISSKSKVTAGFLAFFLGGFGVHRFYLGQWWGLFYLLFSLTLIPGIIAFIEAFVFWFTPRERWQRKYGEVTSGGAAMVLAVVVSIIAFVAFVGILAAIALPAYMDYTTRAKIQAAMPLIHQARDRVEQTILEKNFLPNENVLAGLPEKVSNPDVKSLRLGEGAQLIVTFNAVAAGDNSPTIIWTPEQHGNRVEWDCLAGSMPDKLRPKECRRGN